MSNFQIQQRKRAQKAISDRVRARGATHLNDAEDAEFRRLCEEIEELERRGDLSSTADRIFNAAMATNGNPMTTTESRGHDAYSERRHSYVRDLIGSVTLAVDTSGEGRQRLDGLETRDVTGLTASTAFDPPQFLLDLYARVSRHGKKP
jgi:hypothetical protein